MISDRFADSTLAYQGHGLGLDPTVIGRLSELALGHFAPDLTLILDLPLEIGLGRMRARGGADRYETMETAFHHRVREGFLEIARQAPERCAVVDAAGSETAVTAAILSVVCARLRPPGGP